MADPCAACEEARQMMRAQGFRNWRNHACFDHAAVDLDAWLRDQGIDPDTYGEEPDANG